MDQRQFAAPYEKRLTLIPLVKNGLGALKHAHRAHFEVTASVLCADSLDIDDGLKKGREQENRWDYLLGHVQNTKLIAIEPHSADSSEIKTVIEKRKAASRQLRDHLREGTKISKWIWVASGRTRFLQLEKARLNLDQNGIEFVSGKITNKHFD